MLYEGEPFAVNVWDGDIFGDGANKGLRYTVYVDDTEQGVITALELESGALPELLHGEYGTDDDWHYGEDAICLITRIHDLIELAAEGKV